MAFDLAAKLREAATNLNTPGAEQIEYLPFELLDPDPANFYSIDGLNELADAIATVGILTPLRVRQNGERYTITSGHRRRAAVQLLIDSGEDWSRGLPCIVDRGESTPEWEELKLIFANRQRVKTSAELSREAERTDELFCALKEKGYDFPGRMQEHVAQALGVKASKLKRLHAIRNRAQEYVLDAYDTGKINESVAYELSKCELGVQKMIMVQFIRSGRPTDELTAETVATIANNWTHMCNRPCKADAWTNCRYVGVNHFEEGLRRRFAGITVGNCIKGYCCKGCSALAECEACCEKMELEQQKAMDDRERRQTEIRKTAEELVERRAQDDADRAEICAGIWARIKKAAEASGVELENVLAELCETQSDIDEALRFINGTQVDHGFAAELLASELEFLADRLECSTDFLLGRTEEPGVNRDSLRAAEGVGPYKADEAAKEPGGYRQTGLLLCRVQRIRRAAEASGADLRHVFSMRSLSGRDLETYLSIINGGPDPTHELDELFDDTDELAALADDLECSTDFLLGRSDVPGINDGTGGTSWQTGEPVDEGWFAVLPEMFGEPIDARVFWWDGEKWMNSGHALDRAITVRKWCRLPEEDE